MDGFGIVRRIDELGRVVIPKEFRRSLSIENGDEVEIIFQGDYVAVRKFEPFCVFCTGKENLVKYNGKYICKACKNTLAENK